MTVLAAVVLAWALVAAGFTALAWYACHELEKVTRAIRPPTRWPSVWLLRPCQGDEPGLRDNLASSLLSYPGERHVVFLLPSETDPAYAVAAAVAAGGRAEVVVTAASPRGNHKSAQLAVGFERAVNADPPPEVIVQADSDVRLDGDSLTGIVAALGEDVEVGAAFAPPVELATRTMGDLAASGLVTASLQDFFALAALSRLGGSVTSLAGALAAHRRGELERSGGFAPFVGLLGEDFEIGRRLHARGRRVSVASVPARSVGSGRSLRAVLERTARWVMVVRRQRPALLWAYPALLACTPLVFIASVALAAVGILGPMMVTVGLVGLRLGFALRLRRIHAAPTSAIQALGLFVAAELLMLFATLRAVTVPYVTWRGRRLRILMGGVIEEAE